MSKFNRKTGKLVPVFKRKAKRGRMPFSRRQAKAIRSLVASSGEKHREVNAATNTNIFDNSPLSLSCIQSVSQGDGQGNRQGDEINPLSLQLRGYCKTTGSKEANVRLIVVQYKTNALLTNSLVPSPEEFFPDPDETTSRYNVLLDRVYSLSPNGKDIHFIKASIKKMAKVKFDEGATTVNSGEIYVYVQGDTATSTGQGIEAKITAKLLYADN